MTRTYEEINAKIKDGSVVVVTAEEVIAMVEDSGVSEVMRRVDVVTTGTFSLMCSSGAFLNFGHSDPPIRMTKVTLNGVPAYAGLAAVDAFIGATELQEPMNMKYGGAHVIEDLIAGKDVVLKAQSYGTDCYPRKEFETVFNLAELNQAYLYNPRNLYQNYPAATNSSDKTIYTYMGTQLANFGNVTYCTSGELSPLLNDPDLRTIGVGTRIFFGGAQGYVAWEGTQHVMNDEVEGELHHRHGATLALIGDMKAMSTDYIRGAAINKYGVSMFVGVGVPIPLLDEDMVRNVAIKNSEILTKVVDYSVPFRAKPTLRKVTYEELRSGSIELHGKQVATMPNTSLKKSREIAAILKEWIQKGEFLITEPLETIDRDREFNPLNERKAVE